MLPYYHAFSLGRWSVLFSSEEGLDINKTLKGGRNYILRFLIRFFSEWAGFVKNLWDKLFLGDISLGSDISILAKCTKSMKEGSALEDTPELDSIRPTMWFVIIPPPFYPINYFDKACSLFSCFFF